MNSPRWSPFPLAALVLGLSTAAHAQSTYRVTRIGDEAFNPGVQDINENGEIVGSIGMTEPRRAILLRDGMVTALGDLMGGASPDTSASAVNDLTQITGMSQVQDASGNPVRRGFLWVDGQIRDLGVDPDVMPLDINNRGQIVGASSGRGPFLWEEGRTTFLVTLPCPSAPGGYARAINENGVIVGASASFAGQRAVMWQNGEVMALEPTFPLQAGQAEDVNDRARRLAFTSTRSAHRTGPLSYGVRTA